MRRIIACVALLHCGCATDSGPTKPSTKACEQLRDHVVDLRVAELHQDREAHRAALKQALGDHYVSSCVERPRARFDCEMKASSIDALRNCASEKD
jgi:hypothetical protein